MIRRGLIALATMVLLGGGTAAQRGASDPDATAPAPADTAAKLEPGAPRESQPSSPEPEGTLAWEGVDLYMHDYGPTDGQIRDPTFWAHAERGQRAGSSKIWSLQTIRAVIYREDEDNLVVEAADGQFDEDKETATLAGHVRVTTGPLAMTMEEILWDNVKGAAESECPVSMTNGDMWLNARRIRIHPKDDIIVMNEGSGWIQLSEKKKQ